MMTLDQTAEPGNLQTGALPGDDTTLRSFRAAGFYVTTVHRCAPPDQGGGVSGIDRRSGQVVLDAKVSPTDPRIDEESNPRGGIRGARGVVRLDADHILVASYHSLLVYTNDLRLVDRHTHPLMSGIHAIHLDGDVVWVTSTSIDVLLGYNLETRKAEVVHDLTSSGCVSQLGIKPRGLDLNADFRAEPSVVRGDRTHLNSVLKVEDKLYVLLNRFGAIVDVTADRIVARHKLLRGAHDLVFIPERGQIAINDTVSQSILLFDARSFELVDRLRIARLPGAPLWLTTMKIGLFSQKVASKIFKHRINSSPLFMRGLAYADGHLFSGISPAAVFVTDLGRRKVVEQYRLSRETTGTVYGILPA